jgi:hypothetical protein
MGSFFRWFKKEFTKLLPVITFFFFAFSLANISRIAMHKTTELPYYSFAVVFIASLMMGKVVFLSDLLPITHRFSRLPLVYNTVWKTAIYWACSFAVLLIDHLLPAYLENKNWSESYQKMLDSLSRLEFWVSFGWLGILLLIFVGYRELIYAVGPSKVKKLFFGK